MPESIKQLVVSAFADHDPLLLSALAILSQIYLKFYMGVVLGIINDILHSF